MNSLDGYAVDVDPPEDEGNERRLWLAVVERALEDLKIGPRSEPCRLCRELQTSPRRKSDSVRCEQCDNYYGALEWLGGEDFTLVCENAGLDEVYMEKLIRKATKK